METQDDQAAYDAEFQAALAHDLRNGLPAIIGSQRQIQYATVLRMRALPLVEEAIRLLSEFKSELAVLAVDAAKLLLYRCTNCEFWIEMKECTTAFRWADVFMLSAVILHPRFDGTLDSPTWLRLATVIEQTLSEDFKVSSGL